MLIGPNGAGKTTLVSLHRRHLAAVARASAAVRPTISRDLPEHRRTALGMGRTFQISNVCIDLTVRENLQLGILGTDPRKWTMTRSIGALPISRERASAMNWSVSASPTAPEETVKFLSYGERRQLELALALASSNPKVLLLDEPCAGLSASERQRFSAARRQSAARHHADHDRARHRHRAGARRSRHRASSRQADLRRHAG